MWCNATKLGRNVEDVDLGWVWVALLVVGGLFDAVIFGEVAFDDAGVGSVASFEEGYFEDFGDGCLVPFMRGESPPVRCGGG